MLYNIYIPGFDTPGVVPVEVGVVVDPVVGVPAGLEAGAQGLGRGCVFSRPCWPEV